MAPQLLYRLKRSAKIQEYGWIHQSRSVLMAQAIVDPAELRRFAQNLKQFNHDLQEQLAALHGQLVGLCATWRDQEQLKFTEEFEETMQVIERFVASADQHIPFLLRKAERAEEYLQQR